MRDRYKRRNDQEPGGPVRVRQAVCVASISVGAFASQTVAAGPPVATTNPSGGTVTVVQSKDTSTYVETDAITLTGSLAVHGWHHTGTVRGAGSEGEEFLGVGSPSINMSVASDDGVVTGACAATDGDPTGGTDSRATENRVMQINCLLTDGTGVPWPLTLTATVATFTRSDANNLTWTGRYVGVDPTPTGPTVAAVPASFGILAVTTGYHNFSGATEVGPVTFSGQIHFGSDRFVGDLTGPGPGWTSGAGSAGGTLQPFTISGRDNQGTVTGTCSGSTSSVDPATGLEASISITCAFSRESGPTTAVTLTGLETQNGRRGYYDENHNDTVYRVTA